jgi:thiosulfate reductase/polysulfide reductase chain A
VYGFGREDRRLARGWRKGASDARLVTRIKRDPVMGGTGMNVNFVTVTRWKGA